MKNNNKEKVYSLVEADYLLKKDLQNAVSDTIKKYKRGQKLIKTAFSYAVIFAVIGFIFKNEIYNFIVNMF